MRLPRVALSEIHDAVYRRNRALGRLGWMHADADYAPAFAQYDGWFGDGPGNLLELGCGAGDQTLYFAQRGWRATGIDLSPTAVAWAREKAGDAARFVRGSALALPFADASFDQALDGHCWHCVIGADRPRFLEEAFRVLRSGGTFTGHAMVGPPSGLGREGYDPATGTTIVEGVAVRYWTTVEEAHDSLQAIGFAVGRSLLSPGGDAGPDLLLIDATKP